MTCLAMLRDKKGNLWFAGDRRMSWGYHKAIKAPRPKITKRSGVLLAGTGDCAVCDMVTDVFDVPAFVPGCNTFEYMHHVFMPELLKFLRNSKWVKENERCLLAAQGSASIIIGVEKDLYELDINPGNIDIAAINAPYAAGCGGQLALGSLLTTTNMKLTEKDRLKMALKVAAQVSPGCDNNIDILTNGKK